MKSFCVAKPMQKLRWTERGWSRGFSYCSWKFSRDRALEATTENRWKALGFALVAIARLEIAGRGQWTSFRADRAGVWRCRAKRMRGMAEACMDLEVVSGDRVARHGPWAHFGESWRTNIRRPLRQQGQTRGSSDVFGLADGSAASAPIRPRGCVVCRSRRSSRRARAASLRLAGCQRPK